LGNFEILTKFATNWADGRFCAILSESRLGSTPLISGVYGKNLVALSFDNLEEN